MTQLPGSIKNLKTGTCQCDFRGLAVKIEKRVICKTWTRTLTNSADPDQTPQNAAADLGLHCLLVLQEDLMKVLSPRSELFYQPTLRDNRLTSAVSALIQYCS